MQGGVIRSQKYTNSVLEAQLQRLHIAPLCYVTVGTLVRWFTFDAIFCVHVIVTDIQMRRTMSQPSIVSIFSNYKFHNSVREHKRPTKTVVSRLRVIRAW